MEVVVAQSAFFKKKYYLKVQVTAVSNVVCIGNHALARVHQGTCGKVHTGIFYAYYA